MSPNTHNPSPTSMQQHRELTHAIERKAARFARTPEAGYLAGYSPHIQPAFFERDTRLSGVRNWSAQLAWLYAVAEQDLPSSSYLWEILEENDGTLKLVVAFIQSSIPGSS